jgi:hypothetical protein
MSNQTMKKYQKGDSASLPYGGFSALIHGLKVVFIRLVVLKGEVAVTTNGATHAENILIPDNAKPNLSFIAPVSHFGPNGPTIGQMSFSLSWKGVLIIGDGLTVDTIDSFLVMFTEMYAIGNKAFDSLSLNKLEKAAGVKNLPPINTWVAVPNDVLAVASLAPNPLNSKQVDIDSRLPVTFTALALATRDQKNYLAFKPEISGGCLRASVTFSTWPDFPKGKAQLVATYDVTHLLGTTMPYLYFTHWIDAYASDPGQPLSHVLLSPPDIYNSTVMSGFIPNAQVVFNVHFKQTYANNTLTPLFASFGIVPVAQGKNNQ